MYVIGKSGASGITFISERYRLSFVDRKDSTTYILKKNTVSKLIQKLDKVKKNPIGEGISFIVENYGEWGILFMVGLLTADFNGVTSGSYNFSNALLGFVFTIIFFYCLVKANKRVREWYGRFTRYLGAEHKVIACSKTGEELLIENVREAKRTDPDSSTMLTLYVVLVTVIMEMMLAFFQVNAFLTVKVLFVISASIECYKFEGTVWKPSPVFKLGYWLQEHVLTSEPSDKELQQAITAYEFISDAEDGNINPGVKNALYQGLKISK